MAARTGTEQIVPDRDAVSGRLTGSTPPPPGRANRTSLAGGGPRVGRPWTPYAFLLPAGALLAMFSVFPLVWALAISVQPRGAGKNGTITGFTLENFSSVLTDSRTLDSLRVTVAYALLTTFLCIAFSILTALAIKTVRRGAGVYQAALLIPLTVAPPVVVILWRALFNRNTGAVNGILTRLGIPEQGFYESTGQALYVLVAMAVWTNVGFWTLVYLASLNSVSTEIFEAAELDGCGPIRKFFYVIFPLLRRTTLLAGVVLMSAGLVVFVPAQLLTQGGPGGATNFLMYMASQEVLRYGHPGTANALVALLLLIIATTVALQFRLLRSKDA
ncbi:carbohydrate ABC transporter permease [Jiangella asiatica]|uniref:Sugar ABC transporter permease n=1 Tax=Jiangella asiatica TaxID=2530372 RepID=A0A4R5D4W3_9ACTN|nr:sugar ABC transporter permease [Jiangella asiatica]TDE08479.1 sugar ABC transporter permease [Jiangella asiatica]